jgi:hypothetical protein
MNRQEKVMVGRKRMVNEQSGHFRKSWRREICRQANLKKRVLFELDLEGRQREIGKGHLEVDEKVTN